MAIMSSKVMGRLSPTRSGFVTRDPAMAELVWAVVREAATKRSVEVRRSLKVGMVGPARAR